MSYSKILLNSLKEIKMALKTSLLAALLAGVGLNTTAMMETAFSTPTTAKKRRPKRHKRVYAKHTRGW
jgi:hypothetical protein